MVIHYLVCKVFRNPVEVCIGFSLLQKDRKANDQVICRDMVSIMFEREVTNCVLASSLGKEEDVVHIKKHSKTEHNSLLIGQKSAIMQENEKLAHFRVALILEAGTVELHNN